MTQTHHSSESVRLIKKYPNRRLYDTQTSTYVTLADIKQLVLSHEPLEVIDAKTNADITRSVLLQIILEEEAGEVPMFSADALAHIIRFYGSTMQGVMGEYIEQNIHAFIEIQERMAEQSRTLYGGQLGAEAWTQFMAGQTPVLQNVMNSYMEQSKNMFIQMQEQMQGQAFNMFTNFPFSVGGNKKKE